VCFELIHVDKSNLSTCAVERLGTQAPAATCTNNGDVQ
jgi:hypothetical protein